MIHSNSLSGKQFGGSCYSFKMGGNGLMTEKANQIILLYKNQYKDYKWSLLVYTLHCSCVPDCVLQTFKLVDFTFQSSFMFMDMLSRKFPCTSRLTHICPASPILHSLHAHTLGTDLYPAWHLHAEALALSGVVFGR